MDFNIEDFGADVKNLNNACYIQDAIDSCFSNKGGRVIIPAGKTYFSGTIVLKDNVELYFENGACLKASNNFNDFDYFKRHLKYSDKLETPSYTNCDYNGKPSLYFIYANQAKNIKITGFGTIDGNGIIYKGFEDKYFIDGKFYPRMPLIFLEGVEGLTIKDITLANSAFWTLHLVGVNDGLIDGIRINNSLKTANCDGIDPDHCKNLRISNCFIHCADDAIVFKNTAAEKKYGNCENISVTNCNIITTSAGFKFGTESCSLFKNITITNCNIFNSNRGISIQLRDEGSIENIIFSNINIDTRIFAKQYYWGSSEPICITAVKRKEDTKIGHVKNIVFRNINANSENGILIYGEDDTNISNISFDTVNLSIENKSKWPKVFKDLRPYYKFEMLEDKVNVLYLRNAKNVKFMNFNYEVNHNMDEFKGEDFDLKNAENFKVN